MANSPSSDPRATRPQSQSAGPSPRARRTNQEYREESVASLLQAAEELFITKGFHATKVEEIGARAGLTKGAVYFYFGEKNAVLLALLRRVQERVLDPLAERLESGEGSPMDQVRDFLLQQARLANEEPAMLLLPIMVSIEFAGTGEEADKRVRWGYQRTAELLGRAIERGQSKGLFRRDLSAAQLAALILALNDGAMLLWWRSAPRVIGRGLVDSIYTVLMSGMQVVTAGVQATAKRPTARSEEKT